ncbi:MULTISPECIES: hypothetical protein [unclassified Burkholderia]|uniref:hypothetical protein n=1 Tax=unclassified Burkholderia TaxID=2613784 RepID=UPI00142376B2|nr:MULTISPECIES: hypothetical protein [unclassified Burkholderia]NIE55144.1 hypothetical protein [Burkholderia sp. Ap-955]NIF13165.1 hypothetical protein [Burkholderia sp. Ax-1735]NIG06401.1 hypothetical protein [Burkholderia sp. Tr-849]
MANRTFRISIPGDLDSAFSFLATCIGSAGLTLKNPGTGEITSWSDEGAQIVTAADEVLLKIKSGDMANVQFWSSSSEDMFVSWSQGDCQTIFSLYLDGVDVNYSVAVASKIIEGLLAQDVCGKLFGDVFSLNIE